MHLISSLYSPHHLRMALTSTPTSEDNRRARYPTLIAPGRRQRAGVRTEFDRMIAVMPRGLGTTQVVGADDPSSSAGCGCCWTGGAAMPMCGKEIETHRLFPEAALEGEGLAPPRSAAGEPAGHGHRRTRGPTATGVTGSSTSSNGVHRASTASSPGRIRCVICRKGGRSTLWTAPVNRGRTSSCRPLRSR